MPTIADNETWTVAERAEDCVGNDFDRLIELGVVLPFPDNLDDDEVGTKLWEVIGRLAGLGVYLVNTDHLSDRELYERLWSDVLREEPWSDILSTTRGRCTIVDMVGSGSAEEIREWVTYYADEEARRDWIGVFCDEGAPAHVEPPYDRDRLLPSPVFCRESPPGRDVGS